VIGPRQGFKNRKFPVVNIQDVFIGTGLLWFGWTGFNGFLNII
jgi:ammonia channel protein AmtB